ncbi:MAG TPA: transposase [Terriglobales bacterium]|nr:transposase [Terriglobales bacterium]
MGDSVPLAYFITFRTYGTWLHGDERGAVDRFHNYYGTPWIPPDQDWRTRNERILNHDPVTLTDSQRNSIDHAIRQTCEMRSWLLRALNVRTNHVHVVLSADSNHPDRILNALKANSTSRLRNDRDWSRVSSPWSEGGSKRYVWTEVGLERVIDYVVNGQDGPVPKLD